MSISEKEHVKEKIIIAMRNKLIIFFFSLFLVPGIYAQKGKVIKAEAAYIAGEYTLAIDLFKDVYSSGLINDDHEKTEMIYKIADCYKSINEPRKAEMWFLKAIKKNYTDPIVYLYYADMLKMNEKYEEAVEHYKKYLELVPDDRRGNDGIKSCELSLVWKQNPSGYEIQEVKYFNEKESDYAPCYARGEYDRVYFTSSRPSSGGNDVHGAHGESFADIYESRKDIKGSWSEPTPLGESINSEFDDGAPSMTADYKNMYFTRCKKAKNKNYGCQIYWSARNGEDWSKAQEIKLAADSILVAHPAISPDGNTLYFVSDMDGSIKETTGKNSKDIWKVTLEGDEWGSPVNLGEQINTAGDEVFPYVHPDGTLYFSSNGRVGMGGLDIYKTELDENGNWIVKNMRYPINSPGDDFGITFEKEVERGFFTTSRNGGRDNIYSFHLPPLKFTIVGEVRDQKTNERIPNATVKSVSSDGITLDSKTGSDGTFKFMLKAATDYVFIVSKKGYLNGKYRETTKDRSESTDFKANIFLHSTAQSIQVDNIFYGFNSFELMPESMVALDKLVETLNDNPHVTIELSSHTDARGEHATNDELSQKRAQSVVDYLIEKGIKGDRLKAKGYGKRQPQVVDSNLAKKYPFLFEGDVLTPEFIEKLPNEEQREIAHQVNRRTEFKVLRTDYESR